MNLCPIANSITWIALAAWFVYDRPSMAEEVTLSVVDEDELDTGARLRDKNFEGDIDSTQSLMIKEQSVAPFIAAKCCISLNKPWSVRQSMQSA